MYNLTQTVVTAVITTLYVVSAISDHGLGLRELSFYLGYALIPSLFVALVIGRIGSGCRSVTSWFKSKWAARSGAR